MKSLNIPRAIVMASVVVVLAACQSEVDDKTAATVSEPTPATAAAPATPATPGTEVAVTRETSRIEFVGAKVTRDHTGGFTDFTGSVAWLDGKPSSIAFEIDMNSIFTDTPKLTAHLKTPDFFDVATHPKANFRSTSIGQAPAGNKDGATHTISGTLTMRGTEKAISFPVKVANDASGLTATAEFTINRQDWGVAYKGASDDLIKDEVLIRLDMKFPPAPGTPGPTAAPATQG
ncbi:MAG: YceI family protein [Thermoanaerobaculia bacterium]